MKALLVLCALTTAGSALAADADLLRCRALGDAAARVACYDAIPVAATAAAQATPAGPAATAAVGSEANFGLTAKQMRKSDEPSGFQSTLVGTFSGWGPTTVFRLANGQVWRVADNSSASLESQQAPKVAITRNFFGTVFMEFEGINLSPRVRRVE